MRNRIRVIAAEERVEKPRDEDKDVLLAIAC